MVADKTTCPFCGSNNTSAYNSSVIQYAGATHNCRYCKREWWEGSKEVYRIRFLESELKDAKELTVKINRDRTERDIEINHLRSQLDKSEGVRERMTNAMVKIAINVGIDHHEFSYDDLVEATKNLKKE